MVAETGCDAIMIGRAASANPWIFRQIAQYMERGAYDQPTESDRYEMIRRYYALLAERGAPDVVGKMKQFASYFTHGVRNGAKLRVAIFHAQQAAEILELVDAFFELRNRLAALASRLAVVAHHQRHSSSASWPPPDRSDETSPTDH